MGVLEKLDPFYWFDLLWEKYVGEPENAGERIIYHAAEVVYAIVVAYAIYLLLGLVLHTPKPAVIVASDSMIPTLYKGDIAFVLGVSPEEIRAPEVNVDVPLSHVPLARTPIRVVHKGLAAVAIEVNGQVIPIEKNGDIIVYYNDVYHRDIIHRAVLKIHAPDGTFFLTKGDNDETNPTIDQDCEFGRCIYLFPIPAKNVYGKVFFVIPRIGIVKLWLLGG